MHIHKFIMYRTSYNINIVTLNLIFLHIFIGWLVGWLVVLRIYVALAVFQPYRDLEAGDNKSLKFKWRGGESNPGPLAPQAKSLTTRPPPLPHRFITNIFLEPNLTSLSLCHLHLMFIPSKHKMKKST